MTDDFQGRPVVDTRRALANAVANECARQRWRVESQTEVSAVLAKGQRTSHGLHLLGTVVTAGLWGIVWAIRAYQNRSQHLILQVDEFGNITRDQS